MTNAAVLMLGIYLDPDEARMNEIVQSLEANVSNPEFGRVVAFVEDSIPVFHRELQWQDRPSFRRLRNLLAGSGGKLLLHEVGRRTRFSEFFAFANLHFRDCLTVVANADIYFDATLALLKETDMRGMFACLAKRNVHDGTMPAPHGSQDAWAFMPPLTPMEGDWTPGVLRCENRLAYEALKAGLVVVNPCLSVNAFHLHGSGVRRWRRVDEMDGPGIFVRPCTIEEVRGRVHGAMQEPETAGWWKVGKVKVDVDRLVALAGRGLMDPLSRRYGQSGEDNFIVDFFEKHAPKHKTFCDVGAFDGITFSNTRALVDRGWTGILVEPHPMAFAKLKNLYDGISSMKTVQAAAGDTRRGSMIVLHFPPISLSYEMMYTTCLEEEKGRFPGITEWGQTSVPLLSLKQILALLSEPVEFLSIDCEGMDVEVLSSGEFTADRGPRLVILEHNGNRGGALEKADGLLKALGYTRVFLHGINAAWAKT